MSKHTPEPWKVSHYANGVQYIFAETNERENIATLHGINDIENARRIVACVNACAGCSIEMLEATPVGGVAEIINSLIKIGRDVQP